MLDTLTSENFRDFNQRYINSFGWLMLDASQKKKLLVYVRDVNAKQVLFRDISGRDLYAYADQNTMFEFLPVTRGWFIGKDGQIYLFSRRAARQWTRGISQNNTSIRTISQWGTLGEAPVDLYTLDNVFNNTGVEYKFKDNYVLSQQFAIVRAQLFFFDRVIGGVNFTTKKIQLNEFGQIVKQEVMDVINRRNFGVDVQ